MRAVFVEAERCIGCRHCEIACALEHSKSKDILSLPTESPPSKPRIHVELGYRFLTFPNRCRHCNPAPCMQVCPTGALYWDEDTGSVLVHYDRCIACLMCAMVCPFDIITFERVWNVKIDREVNAKCDNCIERQRRGEIPACVEACKTGALLFGEADELIRDSRKDFTLRTTKALMGEEAAALPESISKWREVLAELTKISTI